MAGLRKSRGEGKANLFFWLILFALVVFFMVKWVPVRVNASHLREHCSQVIVEYVQSPNARDQTVDDLATEIIEFAAVQCKMQLEPDEIVINNEPSGGWIEVDHTVPIDFIVFTWNYRVKFKTDRSQRF